MRHGQVIYRLGEPKRFSISRSPYLIPGGYSTRRQNRRDRRIGNEGMVGLPASFEVRVHLVPAHRADPRNRPAPAYQRAEASGAPRWNARSLDALDALLLRYSQALFNQVAQG